jgi:hypothetical protein
VCEGPAVAILASMLVDRATAAQEGHVGLLKDPPHHRIKQAHRAAENLHAFRPLAGTFIGPGAKIGQMAEDVYCPGRQILGHASIMPPPRGCSRGPWRSPGRSILVQPGDVPRHLPPADPHSG